MEAGQIVGNRSGSDWITFFARQLFICLTICIHYFVSGLSSGSTTVAIPQIKKMANSTEAVSDEMASWIASVFGYTATGFVFILIPMTHFYGRKMCLFLLSINSIAASVLLYFSYNAVHLLISQAMSVAAAMPVFVIILAEYTSAEYRGVFCTLKSATYLLGIWTANEIGIFTDYKYIGLFGTLCSMFNLAAAFYIPESPYWLAFNGRYEDCTKTHRWLKGDKENAEKELSNLMITMQKDLRKKKNKKTFINHVAKYAMNLKHPSVYKPTILCCLIMTAYHMSGKLVYTIYAIEVMMKITSDESTAHISVLILDGFSVLGMYIGCGLSKILNRKTILLAFSAVAPTFLFIMSLYLYLIKLYVISENAYATITILVGYSLAICCGPMLMCSTICGELFSIRCRSLCVSIFAFFCAIMLGTMLKVSLYMFNGFGIHGVFLFFGISLSITLGLIYVYVPETKGKTLYEIAALYEEKESEAVHLSLLTDKRIKTDDTRNDN